MFSSFDSPNRGLGNKISFPTSLVEKTSASESIVSGGVLKAVRKSFLHIYVSKGQAASLLDLI